MGHYSLSEGERLVKAARQTIELSILSTRFRKEMMDKYIEGFKGREGVFVTIEHYPTKEPRGSMGFLTSASSLKDSLIDAALAAATKDPAHIPISHLEFEHMLVQVSVLTECESIKSRSVERIRREIKAGREGLILRSGFRSAVILPEEAARRGWNGEKILSNLCSKAGLPEYSWKHPNVDLYKFRTQTFRELSPGDSVEEVVSG